MIDHDHGHGHGLDLDQILEKDMKKEPDAEAKADQEAAVEVEADQSKKNTVAAIDDPDRGLLPRIVGVHTKEGQDRDLKEDQENTAAVAVVVAGQEAEVEQGDKSFGSNHDIVLSYIHIYI